MARQTAIDRAIASLEGDRAVLDAAIAKLKAQQTQPKKVPRKVAAHAGVGTA